MQEFVAFVSSDNFEESSRLMIGIRKKGSDADIGLSTGSGLDEFIQGETIKISGVEAKIFYMLGENNTVSSVEFRDSGEIITVKNFEISASINFMNNQKIDDVERNLDFQNSKKILESLKLPDETADWKTYRNEEYGFEVKYPNDWGIVGCITGDPSLALKCFTVQKGSWEGTGYLGDVHITILKSSAYESAKKPPSAEITTGTLTENNISVGSQSATEYSYIISNAVIGWSGSDHIKAILMAYHFAVLFNQKVYQVRGQAVKGNKTENDLNQILSTFKFIPQSNSQIKCLETCKCMEKCNESGPTYFIPAKEGSSECSVNSINKICCCSGV